jgi:hypothetical protein
MQTRFIPANGTARLVLLAVLICLTSTTRAAFIDSFAVGPQSLALGPGDSLASDSVTGLDSAQVLGGTRSLVILADADSAFRGLAEGSVSAVISGSTPGSLNIQAAIPYIEQSSSYEPAVRLDYGDIAADWSAFDRIVIRFSTPPNSNVVVQVSVGSSGNGSSVDASVSAGSPAVTILFNDLSGLTPADIDYLSFQWNLTREVSLTLGDIQVTNANPPASTGILIGHTNVDQVAALPQATMEAIGQQKWLFTHASVGGNMIEGMETLHSATPGRYQLVTATAGTGSSVSSPPASTVAGTIYDAPRGNPGWVAKFTMFNNTVRTLGWHDPKIGIAMDKLCYIDQDANPTNYVAMLAALEQDFPATVFVYTTMPLESSANSANILRAGYNNYVRAHCQTNSRVLFDIADVESHDPAGNAITFTNAGTVYQRLYSGYTSDGGHLNTLGEQRVALGWYATAAALVSAAADPQWTSNSLPPGCIAWWQAESNMLDSASSHDGTGSTTPTYGTGRFGQAFRFDGTNQSVMIPDGHADLDGWTQFTLEAWVNFDSLRDSPGPGQAVISKVGNHRGPYSGNFGYQFGFGYTATKLFCQFNTDTLLWPGYQTMVDVPFALSTNVWYHVAATYDHNAVKLYLNGVPLVTNVVGPVTIANTVATLRVSSDDNYNVAFAGRIDDARIYNRALSEREIIYVYAGTPTLDIARTNDQITVSWRAPWGNWLLERTNALPAAVGGSWPQVPPPYQTNAGVISVTFPNSPATGSQFFRLHQP